MNQSDNSGFFLVIELPKKEIVEDADGDDDNWFVPNTYPAGFTSSWTSFVRTQLDYDGGYDR
jgi:hypothetical protein